jgi:DNA primase catalytic subunit
VKDVAAEAAREPGDTRDRRKVIEEEPFLEDEPDGFQYRFEDVEHALEYGFELERILQEKFDFEDTLVVYSGQGAHVYGVDDDPAYRYPTQARMFIVDYLEDRYNIPLDGQVTTDTRRVMRLPYSLHTEVSRVVTPVQDENFDPRTEPLPPFLKQQ